MGFLGHVFGTQYKREDCYENLRISRNAWDTNLCKVNAKFLSVNLEAGGGGQFAVIPLDQTGKVDINYPKITGHAGAVLDTDFNPFNDHIIASCGEDCRVLVWSIPENGLTENIDQPLIRFDRHLRKVGHVLFHPTASNVLLSSSADLLLKLYDIEKQEEMLEFEGHSDIVTSLSWNWEGSLLATTAKDKKLRVIDIRSNSVQSEVNCHQGIKGSRVCWLGDSPFISSVGFSRSSDRQLKIWDTRQMTQAVKTENLDTMSGGLMPFYDEDTKMLWLAGKGDGNIRYYEFKQDAPYIHYLSQFQSPDPQRGIAMLPKRACRVNDCEIARVYKVQTDRIEPISFKVPRKSDQFQPDLFPNTLSDKPALTAQEWFGGANSGPILMSLADRSVNAEAQKPTVHPQLAVSLQVPQDDNSVTSSVSSRDGLSENEKSSENLMKPDGEKSNNTSQESVPEKSISQSFEPPAEQPQRSEPQLENGSSNIDKSQIENLINITANLQRENERIKSLMAKQEEQILALKAQLDSMISTNKLNGTAL